MQTKDKINVTPFDNGIYLYSMANRLLNLSAIGFRSGSIHDPPGQSGMNHLVEHMVVRRSSNYTGRDLDRMFNRFMGGSHGAEINVRCDRTSVLYGHDDLRRREYMWKCFDIYADVIKDVMLDAYGLGPRILDAKALKIEKAAIHNEYRSNGTDLVESHLYDLVHWHLYKTNPAGRRIDCALNDLSCIKLEQVRKFLRERYTTESMFVIFIGPKNNEAVEKVREYFGDLPRLSPSSLNYDHSDDLPVLEGIRSYELVRPGIRQNYAAIAFPAEGYLSKDGEALDVLGAIWEQRIERRLREDNSKFNSGIYHPETYLPRTFTHGMLIATFPTVGDDEYTERAVSIAIEECEKLKTDESAEFAEDCEDRRNYLSDAYEQLFLWYPLNLCEAITEATCNGDIKLKHFLSYQKRLNQVTPKRVREVAKKYFTSPDRFVKVLIKKLTVPQEVIDKAPAEIKPYLLAINHDPDFSGR